MIGRVEERICGLAPLQAPSGQAGDEQSIGALRSDSRAIEQWAGGGDRVRIAVPHKQRSHL
jgi:hypothetical protein